MSRQRPIYYYQNFEEDFVQAPQQNLRLPLDYSWQQSNNFSQQLKSRISTRLARAFSYLLCNYYLKIKFSQAQILIPYQQQGLFLYCNHTLMVGDAFWPFQLFKQQKIALIAEPANLSLPVIGKLLPWAGALITPSYSHQMPQFLTAIAHRIKTNEAVIIYPEAHVWPYYTGIRPLNLAAFHYPVRYRAPSFCATVTYQRPLHGQRPQITIYVDGPFWPDQQQTSKQQQLQLQRQITTCLQKRSTFSNYEYIIYRPRSNP